MARPGSEWHPVLLVVVVENGLLDLGQHFCREAGVLNHTVRHPQGFAVLLRVNILRGRLNLEIKEKFFYQTIALQLKDIEWQTLKSKLLKTRPAQDKNEERHSYPVAENL